MVSLQRKTENHANFNKPLGNGVESLYAYDNIGYDNIGYDNIGQPLSITHKKGTATLGDLGYAYDPVGRITSMGGTFGLSALPPATTTNAVFDANNRLTSFNGALLIYDNNGNLLTRGTRTYVWDARTRLKEIKNSGTTIATFVYDVFGRRQQKTINGVTTQFVYDGHNVVQEKDGAVVKANIRTGLGIDQFLSRTETATNVSRYPLTNHLGSVIALTDSVGAVTTNYLYEPYGNVTVTGEANSNAIQYTGRENDGTALYFYRARYYDPQLMRFMSEDPIGLAGGVNGYGYVGGNPVMFTDSSGLRPTNPTGEPGRSPSDYDPWRYRPFEPSNTGPEAPSPMRDCMVDNLTDVVGRQAAGRAAAHAGSYVGGVGLWLGAFRHAVVKPITPIGAALYGANAYLDCSCRLNPKDASGDSFHGAP